MDKDAVYYCKAQWINNQSLSVQILSTEAGTEGVMGSKCRVAEPALLLCGCQQRGLWCAMRLQKPHQHLPSVVQTQGNEEIMGLSSLCSAWGMRVQALGWQPRKSLGPRAASRPSLEGICWLESKNDKYNKEGDWEPEGTELKGEMFNCISGQFDFCAFCLYEYFLINSGDINYPSWTISKIRSWISPAMKVLELTLSASQKQW